MQALSEKNIAGLEDIQLLVEALKFSISEIWLLIAGSK